MPRDPQIPTMAGKRQAAWHRVILGAIHALTFAGGNEGRRTFWLGVGLVREWVAAVWAFRTWNDSRGDSTVWCGRGWVA